MWWRRAMAVGLALAVSSAASAACGIDAVGQRVDGESAPERIDGAGGHVGDDDAAPGPGDDGGSAPIDTGAPCQTDACALPDLGDAGPAPALALFGDRASACPAGFDAIDVIESPTAGAGSCACGACTKGTANCNSGGIPTFYDTGNGTCSIGGAQHEANNGACRNQNGQFGANASVGATNAVTAACSVGASVPSKAAVTVTSERICRPQASTCASALCATPPAGMKLCAVVEGDTACPPSLPAKHLVGNDFTLTCATCSCSVSATCTGTLGFYPMANCAGTPKNLSTGVCTSTSSASFQSTKWTGSVVTDTCNLGAAPPPSIVLAGPKTVCCN
jgi:hypothetical protein